MLKNIFDPFFRDTLHPGQEGLGLGLYIAYKNAQAHGGTIEVTSTNEKTVFILKMPSSL